ncbi:MAG: UDP-N-acetylmuramate dehydrogenase [Thermomicrobiales bacterium]|nr:UDP-N-acetylmuramate dehydrogenase [Thermomicrobiales bacterium]
MTTRPAAPGIELGPELGERVPLGRQTSLRVGGPADYYLEGKDAPSLSSALEVAARAGLDRLIVGGGSNLLVADEGVAGLVIRYTASGYVIDSSAGVHAVVIADAGIAIANLARRIGRSGWTGLEWASNVPGTVGGAAVNNAGAFGSNMAESVVDVDVISAAGTVATLTRDDLEYAYRTSVLKRGKRGTTLITRVSCRVRRADPGETMSRIREFQAQRTASQPRQSSAGSVFANPAGDFAGRLIEAAGLKGARIGGAEISSHHANFIVNTGRARASDVYSLMRLAQDTVLRQTGIWLEPEIQLVGRWRDDQIRALQRPNGA